MWPWIVGFAIVIALAVVAWFVAEALARNLVTKTIRDEVITQLSLPADQEVDVKVEGAVIPQLIAGSFGEITVASDDVVVDSFSGDVVVTARTCRSAAASWAARRRPSRSTRSSCAR